MIVRIGQTIKAHFPYRTESVPMKVIGFMDNIILCEYEGQEESVVLYKHYDSFRFDVVTV